MSETTGVATINYPSSFKWGSVGYCPVGFEVKVWNCDGPVKKEVPPCKNAKSPKEFEQGEICFRGRTVMMGYLANPALGEDHVAEIAQKNAEAIDDEGTTLCPEKFGTGENIIWTLSQTVYLSMSIGDFSNSKGIRGPLFLVFLCSATELFLPRLDALGRQGLHGQGRFLPHHRAL